MSAFQNKKQYFKPGRLQITLTREKPDCLRAILEFISFQIIPGMIIVDRGVKKKVLNKLLKHYN